MANIGDVVYLASGSQALTVTEVKATGNADLISVVWSDGMIIHSLVIPAAAIVSDDPRPKIAAAEQAIAATFQPAVVATPASPETPAPVVPGA